MTAVRRGLLFGVALGLSAIVMAGCGAARSASRRTTTTSPTKITLPPASPTWTAVAVPTGVGILNDVVCPSSAQCYAVGGAPDGSGPGWIIGSSDGGSNWELLTTTPGDSFSAIACPTAVTCTAVGSAPEPNNQGYFVPEALVTTDRGQHWSSQVVPSQLGGLDGIACTSVDLCIVIGEGIARTTNGGATWSLVSAPPHLSINSLACSTTSFCIIGGAGPGSGATAPSMDSVSQDSGASWSAPVVAGGASGLGEISCSDTQHCVGLIESDATNSYGTGFPIVTSNGGNTWERGSMAVGQSLSCVKSVCISVGGLWQSTTNTYPGDAFVSTDDGIDWSSMNISTPEALNAVTCLSAKDCVAVGGNFPSATTAVIMIYTTAAASSSSATACATADLSLSASQGTASGGTVATNYISTAITHYYLTNTGPHSCTLFGYPGVAVLDTQGTVVQHPAIRQEGPGGTQSVAPATVSLAPGGQAIFVLAQTDSVGPGTDCSAPFPRTTLQVIPPGETVPIRQPYAGIACDLAVGPVQQGTGGTSPSSEVPGVLADCTQPPPVALTPSTGPAQIVFACADAGLGAKNLSWTSWTDSGATGTGTIYEHDCTPSCAQSTVFNMYPGSITLSGAENTAVGPLFSTLTARFQDTGPNGQKSENFDLPLPAE